MYRMLEIKVIESIEEAIKKLGWEMPIKIPVEKPPLTEMGDIATSVAFLLAGEVNKSPKEISDELQKALQKPDLFKKVEAKGPYLNFFINYNKFFILVLNAVREDYGKLDDENVKIILEHTSANPNGPLHIGHIRNAIIGDSLARILRSAGYNVMTHYYVNDMGRQIAMIVWGLLNLDYNIDTPDKPDVTIGKLYYKVNQELKASSRIKNEVDFILKTYEKENPPELEDKFKTVVNKCLEGVKETSKRLHIHHDAFVLESELVRDGSVATVLEGLKNYLKKNEVLYLDLNDYGIEKELILLRSDGTTLYTTRDLAYHLQKSKNADEVLDILGSDHKLAIAQLSVALNLLKSQSPEVIFYEFITLPEGSMSTRRGVFISVDDLMDEAIERARKELEDRRPELNKWQINNISEIVGIGAIRYYIARLSPEKHIVFKWDEALSFEKGCASIQYAHARSCKLLEKANFNELKIELDKEVLNFQKEFELNNFEVDLIKTISRFTSIIRESAQTRKVHLVAQYALELAGAFNKFYKSVPVIGSEREAFRLLLVDKSRITLQNSLNLLGIEAPRYM